MQQYYEEMLEKENIDLDLLIAQERVKLDHAKNLNSLFVTCYIGFLVLGLTGVLIADLKYTHYIFPSYVFVALAAIGIGIFFYKHSVWEPLYKVEVLNYLKAINFTGSPKESPKEDIFFRS